VIGDGLADGGPVAERIKRREERDAFLPFSFSGPE
jgi:hypothetical protein